MLAADPLTAALVAQIEKMGGGNLLPNGSMTPKSSHHPVTFKSWSTSELTPHTHPLSKSPKD